METFICIAIFIFAFILILKGGDLLVESSVWFSRKAKIPSLVVGATIVAIATTFPEVSVALFSGLKGAEDLAVSTALGSMISNFALVLGISFITLPSVVKKDGFIGKVVYFVLAVFVLLILGIDNRISLLDAIILFIVFGVFLTISFVEARRKSEPELESAQDYPGWSKIILQFLISAFAIGYGANVLVSNVESLSNLLGISEGLIGTIVISVGTNIPEFVTTLTAVKQRNTEIGLGNIFGSSIIDSTMLIAVTVFSSATKTIFINRMLLIVTVAMVLLITAIIVFPILKKGKSNRIQGAILIILFVIYSLILAKIS